MAAAGVKRTTYYDDRDRRFVTVAMRAPFVLHVKHSRTVTTLAAATKAGKAVTV